MMNSLQKIQKLVATARQRGLDVSFSLYFEDGDGYEADAAHAKNQVIELLFPEGDQPEENPLIARLVMEVVGFAETHGFKLDDLPPTAQDMVTTSLYFSRPYSLIDDFMKWVGRETGKTTKTSRSVKAVEILGCSRARFWDWLSGAHKPSEKWSTQMLRLMYPRRRRR